MTQECRISNTTEYNEPNEINFQSAKNILKTLSAIDGKISEIHQKIRKIDDIIPTLGIYQFTEKGLDENDLLKDVNRGLEGLELSSKKCGFEAMKESLLENEQGLINRFQELAKKKDTDLIVYKEYLKEKISSYKIRIPIFINPQSPQNSQGYINIFIADFESHREFFNISEKKLSELFSSGNPESMDELMVIIENFEIKK